MSETKQAFRLLPSIDEALRNPVVAAFEGRVPRSVLSEIVQEVVEGWRAAILAGSLAAGELERSLAAGELERAVGALIAREEGRGVKRAINATGVVLNTGLGRAPVHPEVALRMGEAAGSYCVLEVDRFTGQRNQRDDRLAELLRRLTGAEAAIAVNNNAAAAFLTMHTFAAGREAIVSRGELVEIGGAFRVPDVMQSAGVRLVEVGATNRTRIADYERGIGPETSLLMKVHTSNFRMIGFTEEVAPAELAELGQRTGLASAYDLGSGLVQLEGTPPIAGLEGETRLQDAVASGIDVITFSGDKLLGGPQAGLVVGRHAAVERMRRNPIYRAVRLDKVALCGLEATLELILAGRGHEVPARAMLALTAAQVEVRARELAQALREGPALQVDVIPSSSEPGSGSAPGVYLDTFVVRVRSPLLSPEQLTAALRRSDPPVFARIQDGALLLDPRTLLPGDQLLLARVFRALG